MSMLLPTDKLIELTTLWFNETFDNETFIAMENFQMIENSDTFSERVLGDLISQVSAVETYNDSFAFCESLSNIVKEWTYKTFSTDSEASEGVISDLSLYSMDCSVSFRSYVMTALFDLGVDDIEL